MNLRGQNTVSTRWTKILISLLLLLSLSFIIGIFSDHLIPKHRSIKIGASYMTMNNEFYKILNAEIEKFAQEENYKLLVRDPELNEEKQAQQIESFIEEGVSLIVLNPVKNKSQLVDKALKKAGKANIPVVVVDAPVETKEKIATTVMSDNYQAGRLLAQHLLKTRKNAQILILEHKDAASGRDRIQGFEDGLKGKTNYRIVGRLETFGQTEIAMPQVEKAIDEVRRVRRFSSEVGPDRPDYRKISDEFDMIMSLNDRAAIGALAAIEDRKASEKIGIYGVDGSPEFKHFLGENPHVLATAAQSPVKMGRQTAKVMQKILDGEKVKDLYKIPVQLVTATNVQKVGKLEWQ